MARLQRRRRDERGASLVEFAFVVPILVLFVFGIIDFGNLYFEKLAVRHGAREGARLAVVNYAPLSSSDPCDSQPDQTSKIICTIDQRTEGLTSPTVQMYRTGDDIGQTVKVRLCYPLQSLSGVMTPFLPKNGRLSSTVEMRVEQKQTWTANWNGTGKCP